MAVPHALVLTGFGINCDYETAHAFELAGARASRVHVNDLIDDPSILPASQVLAVPGGFSFGDDIASGKVLANKMLFRLGEAVREFLVRDTLVIGICNGFQVLVRLGVLPGGAQAIGDQTVTLTYNDSGKFEDRWVRLRAAGGSPCVFTRGISECELPVRHGEGKFIAGGDSQLESLASGGLVALRYASPGGERPVPYPLNPNGSEDDIAGICDRSGRVFGLMPHPEAFVHFHHHPHWTRRQRDPEGDGLAFFRNAVDYYR